MSDWKQTTLGELVDIRKGVKVEVFDEQRADAAPYLGAGSLESGKSRKWASTRGAVLAESADVLMLWDGERSGLTGGGLEGVVASTVSRLRPRGIVDPAYLRHTLQAKFRWIQARRTGTGVPHVPKDLGNWLIVDHPESIADQRRIAELADALDDQISATERIVAKMVTSRHGLVERLITQEAPNAILASALLGAPANGIYKPAHLIGRGALLVGQTAINSDRRVIPSLARRGEVVPAELQRFGLIAGDILVSRVYATLDGVGQPALVEHLGEVSVFESNMMRLRCDGSKADPFFIFQTLLTSSARAHVVRRANLSNQASISQAVLTEFPLWLPSIERQLDVGRAIRSVEAGIEAERARLTKLRAIKSGLLDDLLTGRVRVAEGAGS